MLAQMIHQSNLATWFARVAAVTLIWLAVPPLLAFYIGAAVGELGMVGFGGLVSLIGTTAYLTGVHAPLPSPEVLELLDQEAG